MNDANRKGVTRLELMEIDGYTWRWGGVNLKSPDSREGLIGRGKEWYFIFTPPHQYSPKRRKKTDSTIKAPNGV